MLLVANVVTKQGDKVGDRSIKSISPRAADKIYERIIQGPKGARLRQGEKVIALCRHAWNVAHRLSTQNNSIAMFRILGWELPRSAVR
jgi:hypothetical protein